MAIRSRTTRPDKGHPGRSSGIGSFVAGALSLVAVTLVVAATNDLITHTAPGPTVEAMIAAGVSALVLAPLGWAKYRTGQRLNSHALMGDGTLSALGS